jgi:hypothetical protein
MLSQKALTVVLIAVSALTSLYFWGLAARVFLAQHSLQEQIPVHVVQWEVQEMSSDQYALQVNYSFERDGHTYQGNTLFTKPIYLNQTAAILALQTQALLPRVAWVDPKNPKRSTLAKKFPQGLVTRALVSSGVLLYFILFYRRKTDVGCRAAQ